MATSARGKSIEAARKRVNARRAARNRENYMATQGRNIKKRPIVDSNQGQGLKANLAQLNRDASQLPVLRELNDLRGDFTGAAKKGIERFIDYFPEGAKEKFLGLQKAMVDAFGRNAEEVGAASRDYDIPFYKGGNPIAVDKGSRSNQFLRGLMQDKSAYDQAVRDDKVFYTGLEEMSGDNYEASHPGYIALLNDPSRLKDMSPIRGLNYMRSITGDPSNMGFDEFEAMRQEQPDVYGGLTATQIAQKLLPQYQAAADEMYGEGFIANKAPEYVDVDPEIMNYRDPIRDMVSSVVPESEREISIEDLYIAPNEYSNQPNIDAYNEMMTTPTPTWSIYDTFPGLSNAMPGLLPKNLDKPLEEMTAGEAALWAAKNPSAALNLGWSPKL